jgi:hypothetical protein
MSAYGSYVPIVVTPGNGNIFGYISWEWDVDDDNLLAWTQEVLKVFEDIELEIIDKKDEQKEKGLPLTGSLTLTPERCRQHLAALAEWGTIAYREFFDADARAFLASYFDGLAEVPAPTFHSKLTLFPWEVLYEGEDYEVGDPQTFWGLRYSLARVLDARNVTKYELEQAATSKMLFCLHHRLREAHQHEWPQIERLVKATEQDHVELLGPNETLAHVTDGKTLLAHLYKCQHNMVHFACHANPDDAGADVLRLSLIDLADLVTITDKDFSTAEIALSTNVFSLKQGILASKPLVFLNACQTGGGADRLRKMYNLPRKFVECQAGAVIATACPVPDVFAAEFARVFYGYFLRGQDMLAEHPEETRVGPLPIGEALWLTRRYFVERHHNPLGLAYGLYSPAHYRVARAFQTGALVP